MSSNKNKNKNNSNISKIPEKKTVVDEIKNDNPEAEKSSVKYFIKSSKELGFEKRNFFLPGVNKRFLIEADAEIDEKTYNLFSEHARKAFFKK